MMASSFHWLLLLTILICGVSGCNNKVDSEPASDPAVVENDPPAADTVLSGEDYAKALILKNRGIGHLENKEWADADSAMTELVELLPSNILAARNLAVGRVLVLVDREQIYQRSGSAENIKQFDAAVQSAQAAIDAYGDLAIENEDVAIAEMLRGRLFTHSSDDPRYDDGVQYLKNAADRLPEVAEFRFAIAMAMDGSRNYTDPNNPRSAELIQTLQQAFELAPQNLFALQKLMQRQALCLNSKLDETKTLALQITDTLKAAQKLLAPLNDSMKKQHNRDVDAIITTALEKYDGTNGATLTYPAMMTSNLMLPEIATQIDQRRLNKNLLEYLLQEFDDEFLQAAKIAGAIPDAEPTVVKSFEPTEGLPQLTGVTHVDLQDMNLDGFDDLIVARAGKIEVYSRGTELTSDWTLLMASPEASIGVTEFLLADIDRDFDKALSDIKNPSLLRDADGDQKIPTDPAGKNRWYDTDLDVIGYGKAGVVIFRNDVGEDDARSFSIVPQEESVPNINDVVAADLEADGDLDLVLGTDDGLTLWKNLDGSVFENMNEAVGGTTPGGVQSLLAVDWNRDLAIDVLCESTPGAEGAEYFLLENMFHGRMRVLTGVGMNAQGSCKWMTSGRNGGQWQTVDLNALGLQHSVDESVVGDFDNDGFSDALSFSEEGATCVRGLGGENCDARGFPDLKVSGMKSAAAADFDEDGDLDIIYVSADDSSLGLLINDGGNTNSWIDVVVRAVPDDPQFPSNRVNMHSIGSVIEMRAGGLYHAEVITQPRVHLGLGKEKAADAIRVIWTDGIPQNVMVPELLKPRVGILAPQILKGSCPYIYTWTGERFEFFSDCLWAAPIGLVQANGEIAPTREWENLLIAGEALVEKDGRYAIQLTEELWETAYFDHVQLTAIDHPADVSIFTNEKVGPPHLAEHRVHTVKNALMPKSIVDGCGNDLLPGLAVQDGNYIQPFQGRVLQGLTDDWTMEFDLGELSSPENIRLFMLGWVFPTDTSLNAGIEQNPNLNPPAGPSLEVPDGNGGWKVARPFIGFPSGKTKAMVVDISDLFDGDDYRFRIRSSMELYWDRAFFTVNEQDAETHSQACELTTGDLHFRGFSRRTYADNALFRQGHAPEGYDYESVTTSPRWPPISGRFTRYGDATPLLGDHDDQMVVMGPGDELTLSFAVPAEPVPAGWKRDFVLRNVGYDKDADLNTIYGQSSEPFPFKAMSRYPFAPNDQVPDSPEYNRYLEEWQTREYSVKPFWNALKR